jgi:hypothetical protein
MSNLYRAMRAVKACESTARVQSMPFEPELKEGLKAADGIVNAVRSTSIALYQAYQQHMTGGNKQPAQFEVLKAEILDELYKSVLDPNGL